jgi:hypothetical protein
MGISPLRVVNKSTNLDLELSLSLSLKQITRSRLNAVVGHRRSPHALNQQ